MDCGNYTVRTTKLADNDLISTVQYLTVNLENSWAAKRLVDEYEQTKVTLSQNPYRFSFAPFPHLAKRGYHRCFVRSYVAYYRIIESQKEVRIMRFGHKTRDWGNILR
jgi:plasmid stabilization system protein ParE